MTLDAASLHHKYFSHHTSAVNALGTYLDVILQIPAYIYFYAFILL